MFSLKITSVYEDCLCGILTDETEKDVRYVCGVALDCRYFKVRDGKVWLGTASADGRHVVRYGFVGSGYSFKVKFGNRFYPVELKRDREALGVRRPVVWALSSFSDEGWEDLCKVYQGRGNECMMIGLATNYNKFDRRYFAAPVEVDEDELIDVADEDKIIFD